MGCLSQKTLENSILFHFPQIVLRLLFQLPPPPLSSFWYSVVHCFPSRASQQRHGERRHASGAQGHWTSNFGSFMAAGRDHCTDRRECPVGMSTSRLPPPSRHCGVKELQEFVLIRWPEVSFNDTTKRQRNERKSYRATPLRSCLSTVRKRPRNRDYRSCRKSLLKVCGEPWLGCVQNQRTR